MRTLSEVRASLAIRETITIEAPDDVEAFQKLTELLELWRQADDGLGPSVLSVNVSQQHEELEGGGMSPFDFHTVLEVTVDSMTSLEDLPEVTSRMGIR